MCHSPLWTIHPAPNRRYQEVEMGEKYVWLLYRVIKPITIKCPHMPISSFSREFYPKTKNVSYYLKYICNLYDENGTFKSIGCIMPFVQKKNNILCEYMILKTVFAKLSKHFNFSNAIHVNPRKTYAFLFHDGMKYISEQKCKLFYNSLLEKKKQMPSFQSILANTFDIHEHVHWKKKYCNKIKHISDPNIAEFNYKLLHNILNNNYLVSKCRFCHAQIENTKHLIYECDNVQNIWFVQGNIYGFRIQKHVVVGFYVEDNNL